MTSFDRDKLEYRKSTQAFIIKDRRILLFQGIDFPNDMWSFPGGGMNDSETPEHALERELHEEFPDNTFKIVAESKTPLAYEWSDEMILKDLATKGSSFRGQSKIQFLVQLNEDEINSYDKNEIRNLKWVDIKDINDYLQEGRRESTIKALKEFGVIGESA